MHDGCSGGKLGDFGLLLFILLQLFLIALFLLRRIEAVVAGVELRLALVQLDHPGDHLVQKVAVMGNGQHRSLETGQIVFQPFHRVEIQMVGWFVQQQNIGIFQNQAPQIDPGLFPARELLKLLPAHGFWNAQTVADLAHLHVCVISACQFQRGVQLVIALQNLPAGVAGRHFLRQHPHLPLNSVDPLKGTAQHLFHSIARRIDWDLRDQTDSASRSDRDFPLIIVVFTGQNLEQSALPAPIFAQQSHTLSLVDVESDAIQDIVPDGEGFYQIGYGKINHDTALPIFSKISITALAG